LRVCLVLALMAILGAVTQQQMTQADEPVLPSAVECPNQLQSYWKLDEDTGPTYEDSRGDNDATCGGGLPCPTKYNELGPPSIDGAQTFNATSKLNVAPNALYDWSATDNFSIEFWMRTPSSSNCQGNQVVIGRDAANTESSLHWWVGCITGGAAAITLRDTAGVSHYATRAPDDPTRPPIDVTDGAWHHIVGVRYGNTGSLRLYVDGTHEAGDPSASDYTGTFGSPTAPLNIGWLNYSPSNTFHFVGEIDELAIYSRVLQQSEVEEHYARHASYCVSASIDLVKTASAAAVREGDTVVYTYAVTNDGNENLGLVNLSDDTCAPVSGPTGDTGIIGQLEIGETWNYTCSQVLYGDTTNTATVTAIGVTGVHVSDSDAEAVTVTPVHPSIQITKQADKNVVVVGDVAVYSYQVSNTGDIELTNVVVTDDQCSPVTGPQGTTLAVGASASFGCAQALTQTTTNTGTATANHQGLSRTVTDDSGPVTVQVAGLSIVKSASAPAVEPGQTVIYQYTVENIGDISLTNVHVTDDRCSPVFGPQNTPFAPGQIAVFTCAQVLNQTTKNTGTATGNYPGGTVIAQDSVTVQVDRYYIYIPIALSGSH